MKYWRGYLVAAIFAAMTWALNRLGSSLSGLVDMVYPYMTRTIESMLAQWSGTVDVCLWQVGAIVLAVLALASVVLMIVLRWNPIQWLGWILAVCSFGFCFHTLIYGLNQYAGPLAEDIRLEEREYTLEDMERGTVYFRDQANTLAQKMPRDKDGQPEFADFETLAQQAGAGFHALTYDKYLSVFGGSTLPVKKLAWGDMYTSMGITGITMAVTGESAVNPNIPAVSLPFTMCHEMAHRMSIANERDANLAAFLASRENPDEQFQYSAYFMAYLYCRSALSAVGTTEASQVSARVRAEENALLKADIQSYNDYFQSRKNEKAEKAATTANNAYLKASGDSQGTLSYGQVSGLLVDWYLQEIWEPTQVQEPENRFNPLEVDPYAPLTTEPGATDAAEDAA